MSKTNPQVDGYLRKDPQWREELQKLREIILTSPLTEEVKWRVPCYTLQGKNILFIGRLKESCVLSFVKGVLLKDAKRILIQQTENSQSVRVIRFTDLQQIAKLEPVLKAYIREAVDVEKAGLKVNLKTPADFVIPAELQVQFENTPELKKAFDGLTPGRRRAYLLHFTGAKQSKTRAARVEKCLPRILSGKGIDD